ncbi:hypothetical protein N431DRAFT_433678 [Stipitochalara longipes BDJ]|nr:hypothetical protein N431DRAFT_433678 [Stipitochalara longipes BDJ]
MVDVVSIIIAVVSLVGSIASVGFTGWLSFYVDRAKKRSDANDIKNNKYRDPLILASFDLQARVWALAQGNIVRYAEDEEKKDVVYIHTAFLFGQYLAWAYILRRQTQFLRFIADPTSQQFSTIMDTIAMEFSLDRDPEEHAFMLWRGHQMAIGELMTVKEDNELYCMGFSAFTEKYHNDPKFKKWFQPIESGITLLAEAVEHGNPAATYRLRRLQHLLVDFVIHLDQHIVSSSRVMKVDTAPQCRCDNCPGIIAAESQFVSPTAKLPEP